MDDLQRVTEAIVFAADEPVPALRIAQVFAEVRGVDPPSSAEVEAAVAGLNERYGSEGFSLRIHAWAGGFRMATIPEVAPFLKAFLNLERTRRLSRSLLEALAVVAYKQPVTKPEVDFVRGVDSDYALRRLMEVDMIQVVGRGESVGRPLLYGTTIGFLEKFGLKSIEDLPNLRELEELLDDPTFNREQARHLLHKAITSTAEDVSESASRDPEARMRLLTDDQESQGGNGQSKTEE